ncbi:hypothetical protein Mal52_53790 [Symmachiella dynata]|uniref:DUF429 domain-containing protein n=1 Tax=Symmachiella dynata TaxID=2527995 RepID=A0A517ZWP0_9PLAN|nr:DUF429 domain-containing protein [Symmachiella dynata]QDU46856.1 hypothetical protein Mal52_53790 [Symmachiella dynata]
MNEQPLRDTEASGQVLGIDVGWSEQIDTTGACLLRWTENRISFDVHHIPTDYEARQRTLRELVGDQEFHAVALDGPLRPGLDRIDEYRLAELLLTRRFSNLGFGKPGQSSSPNGIMLNEHANLFAQSVIAAGCVRKSEHAAAIHEMAVVEAFPTTFLAVMLDEDRRPSSKAKSDIFYEWLLGPDAPGRHMPDENRFEELISRLLPNRTIESTTGDVTDHEHRAAVICALTALCVAKRDYVGIGDSRNGYIILPPRVEVSEAGLQPWAMSMIRANAREARRWERDGLSQSPPAPHVIIELGGQVDNFDAEYK